MAEVIKYSLEHCLRNTFQSILTDELCMKPQAIEAGVLNHAKISFKFSDSCWCFAIGKTKTCFLLKPVRS